MGRNDPRIELIDGDAWRVDDAGCWVWQHYKNDAGYGIIYRGGKRYRAHRFIYEHMVAPVDANLDMDHLCRNPSCVNPDHLDPVEHAENCRRGVRVKLTRGQVAEIAASIGKTRDVAARYGINHGTVSRIRNQKRWAAA